MRVNAPPTITPTQRVSQLPTGRGTIRVPTTLNAAVSTSRAPTTAATSRAAIGTAMAISSDLGGLNDGRPPERAPGVIASCLAWLRELAGYWTDDSLLADDPRCIVARGELGQK